MNDQIGKPQISIGDIIGRVRKIDAKIAEMEAKFEEELKPLKDMSEAGRAFLLKYLNETGQKGASTTEGGCHKTTKVTYQVRDREKFKAHVISTQSWEMIVWRANDAICEDYVTANKTLPPGSYRNALEILTVTAPPKPRLRKKKPGTMTEEEWEALAKEVDEEEATRESNGNNGEEA